MSKIEYDVLTGEETFKGEHVQEEMEFYDMGNLESKLFKKLSVIEDKLDAVMSEVEDNNHRLKNIQFQFTRQLIIRLIKWGIIIGFVYWLYSSFIGPIVEKAGDKYFQIDSALNRLDQVNSNTSSFGETIDKLFPNASNVLETLRPGQTESDTETSTSSPVEN